MPAQSPALALASGQRLCHKTAKDRPSTRTMGPGRVGLWGDYSSPVPGSKGNLPRSNGALTAPGPAGRGRARSCEWCRAQASTTYQRPQPSRRQPEVTVGSGQLAGRPSSSTYTKRWQRPRSAAQAPA